jgi:hypothetical protein
VTNLRRRLKKLEAKLTDPTGLVPHSQKWLEYWQRWIDRWSDDPSFSVTQAQMRSLCKQEDLTHHGSLTECTCCALNSE